MTKEKVGAIVNTLGDDPKIEGPLFKAILKAGGDSIRNELIQANKYILNLENLVGKTSGHKLLANFVIHAKLDYFNKTKPKVSEQHLKKII